MLLAFFARPTATKRDTFRSSELEKVQVDNNTIEYRLNGKLKNATDLHYARMVKTSDGIEQYFDEEGNPAKQPAGHYALRRLYDGKVEIATTYLDENLQPTTNTSGYATRERLFQDGHVIEEWYKDTEGNPVATTSGAYGRLNGWEGNRNTSIKYVGADGSPVNIKSGYAELRRSYFEEDPIKGKVREEYYFDEEGKPATLSRGQHGYRNELDETGRRVRVDFLDPEGDVLSSVVYPSATEERYFDASGKPQRQIGGYYGIRRENGKTIYLDRNGRPTFLLKKFLYANPVAVVIIGLVVLGLSFILPRKTNIALLIAYVIIILYMTLMDREGESRAQLELFWSYRQFFTSESLRMEIIYNILLFVPLGGILERLRCTKPVLFCIFLSIAIEIIQYLTGLGLAEFDDVISNGLGGMIGVIAYRLLSIRNG